MSVPRFRIAAIYRQIAYEERNTCHILLSAILLLRSAATKGARLNSGRAEDVGWEKQQWFSLQYFILPRTSIEIWI